MYQRAGFMRRSDGGGVGAVLVVVTLAMVACSEPIAVRPTATPDATAVASGPAETAASTVTPAAAATPRCSFGVPMNLGGDVNTPGFDGGPTPSADGLRLYFVSDRPGSQGGDLWVAERPAPDAPFGPAEHLGAGVNGEGNEGAPSLSSDELVLVFDRDDGGIWTATRPATDSPFETAERLGGPVSVPFAGFPALSPDGLTLYFSSERPDGQGDMDIWRATRDDTGQPFDDVENIGSPLNGSSADAMATVSADGLSIYFASMRGDGEGDWDLWMAERPDPGAAFGSPVNLGPGVNADGFEGRPQLASDGSVLYFMSDRMGGQGAIDIWQVEVDCSAS